ncbi:hypothetical protein IL306_007556 [Fusarium sp. DS 682]|nr:hypothetical protein IL306_007556 [Fusarium sp. DS 682]
MKRIITTDSPQVKRRRNNLDGIEPALEISSAPASDLKLMVQDTRPQVPNDEQELNIIQSNIGQIKSGPTFFDAMVLNGREAMNRCNPEPTKRAIQEISSRRQNAMRTLAKTDFMVTQLSRSICTQGNLANSQLYQSLNICEDNQTRLKKDGRGIDLTVFGTSRRRQDFI